MESDHFLTPWQGWENVHALTGGLGNPAGDMEINGIEIMELSYDITGIFMDISWDIHGYFMGFHGIFMDISWDFMGYSWIFHGKKL